MKWKTRIGRGFDPWVRETLASVSKTYSYMLIRLARHVEHKEADCLKDTKHMMGALRLAGVFPREGTRRKIPAGSDPAELARAFAWRLGRFNMDKMTPQMRADVKKELKPVRGFTGGSRYYRLFSFDPKGTFSEP